MPHELLTYPNAAGTGTLVVLSALDACQLQSSTRSIPWPRLTFLDEWMRIRGIGPEARVANVVTSASSSTLVVHTLREGRGLLVAYRFIVVEASTGGEVRDVAGNVLVSVQEGQYVDLVIQRSGDVIPDTPKTFDPNTTPGSEGIMATIEAERLAAGIA